MYILYHYPLCPFSRLVRIILLEKQIPYKLIEKKPWVRDYELASLNPAFELPVLIADDRPISSAYAICEYLETLNEEISFLSSNNLDNAEIRRIFSWFTSKFYSEVTKLIFDEKIIAHFVEKHSPRANYIRAARANLKYHLDYIEFLLKTRKWLAGNIISFADLAAATQISTLDYLGELDWDKHEHAKEWYSIIKSRPSFRSILTDRIRGFTPPAHYQNLDF
ncbi:MAG: glutathione S-transferase family protein [Pseudomonadota bacterium]